MRLRAGVACCLLLSVIILLLHVITTAQSDQEITHRIDELELIPTEEESTDEEADMEELTTEEEEEEEGSVSFTVGQGTETTLILNSVGTFNGEAAPEQAGPQTSFAPGEAIRYVARIKNTGSSTVTASLDYLVTGPKDIFSLIDDIAIPPDPPEGGWNLYSTTTVPTDAPSGTYTLRVTMTINGQSSTKESSFTVLGGSGLPPAAPSNVQAVEITHEGRLSTEVSWTDNADNELGYFVVDQNRPQEYEADPVPGVGSIGSLILPFVSSFCVYAYNDYGVSDEVCTGEVVASADSFTYPVDRSKAWRNDYDGHTNRPEDWSKCYNVAYNIPWHAGQDYGFPARKASDGTWTNDTSVNAVANGVVRYSSKDPGTTKTYPGGVVIIEHTLPDGQLIYSMYGHLDPDKILVSASTKEKVIIVTKGQQIANGLKPQVGTIDNTHLHWEMRYFYDGSEIKQAPNYTDQCATQPGPGYTYHKNDELAHPDNFQGVIGKNPDGTLKYKFFQWINPEEFVATNQ